MIEFHRTKIKKIRKNVVCIYFFLIKKNLKYNLYKINYLSLNQITLTFLRRHESQAFETRWRLEEGTSSGISMLILCKESKYYFVQKSLSDKVESFSIYKVWKAQNKFKKLEKMDKWYLQKKKKKSNLIFQSFIFIFLQLLFILYYNNNQYHGLRNFFIIFN